MNTIAEKVVVITGASSGLGEATARLLAARGAKLILGARRLDKLEKLASEITAAGGEALAVTTDVAKHDDVVNLIQSALKKYGKVDVLVNNAGVMPMAAMSKLKVDEWDLMIDINIKGVLYGIAAVLPNMLNEKNGHIINLSSVAGLRVSAGVGTVYSATKFAVKAISEGLRAEVGSSGIRVTTLYPGAVASELVNGSSDAEASSAMKSFYENYEISADSVAKAIVFAVEQPDDVSINEITLRPTSQEF
ncbi:MULTISPECIES: SDR family oxidoreductase [Citrobacter]|uniref:SDR family oxidoreductase n=1 Tax=Citrobacter TaxID=544 RepID=UPI000E3D252D|nr:MULTISPECIES: SDR family oxidoreductase [Citrobacter]MBD0826534.1 SDR family oxidoreductase [Citrobacter sp. C1]RFU93263.1 SDR family oxidoreductase [Citrobacter gillenii]